MPVDPVDNIVLNGTTLLCAGIQAGKSVSEFTSGLKIGRATYDDRQHAFYAVLDDFSGGFGYRQLDIREALGTHWDNEGGVDLRRARHITLPPRRYVVNADNEPGAMLLSSEILDGAALSVPTEDPAGSVTDYFYYGAGDTVYRINANRDSLVRVKQMVDGDPITSHADNTPEKMTRFFMFRSALGTRRLYVVTANGNVAGSSSRYIYTEDPGAATPTWTEGTKALWDAIVVPVGDEGANIVIAQDVGSMQFMYAADPRDTDDAGVTDWNIDQTDDAINPPIWTPHSICRFIGVGIGPQSPVVGVYFIDYGDGRLYFYNHNIRKARPIDIGDYHYLLNGVVWQGNLVVTDGWDVWLYTPGGGGTEMVRKIGLWGRDGVPNSLRAGRYRITGLVDGGHQLFAIAERMSGDKAHLATVTLGFVVLVYNGAGWSEFTEKIEAAATSTTLAVNPINATIDRYPSGVHTAANMQIQTSRALAVLCQAHPTAVMKIQLRAFRLPQIGTIPIDEIDEFEASQSVPGHPFRTGWIDGGFNDVYGALFYLKVDLQSIGGTGKVKIEYRLDDDESGAFTTLGTVDALEADDSASILQFDSTNKAGVKFRTVQFQVTLLRDEATNLSAGMSDSQDTVPVDELQHFPDSGVVQIDSEVISYPVKSAASGAGNLGVTSTSPVTRGVRGTDAAAHNDNSEVHAINRTPELRALALIYRKKSKLRKTWVALVDVDKMVEQGTLVDTDDDGTPDAAATHQNVWDFLETIWDKQTLVKLILPEMEPTGDNVRVEIADMTYVQDDNRTTVSVRGRINLTLIQPVRA